MAEKTRGRAAYATKICPRCGSELYEDMTVCYGCLYDFAREHEAPPVLPPLPEQPDDERACDDTEDLSAARSRLADEARTGAYLRTGLLDTWLPIGEKGLVVGRDPECDVVLHSPAVSRRHLRLEPTPEGMEVADLGSTNPATYRGREVTGRVVVPYGDSVDVCGCRLTMTGPPASRHG